MKSVSENRRDFILLASMVLVLSIPTFLHCWWFPRDLASFLPINMTIALLVAGLVLWIPWRWLRWLLFTLLFVGTLFESAHLMVYDGDIACAGYLRSLFMTTPYEADGAVWRIICQNKYVVMIVVAFYLAVSVLLFFVRPSRSWQKWIVSISGILLLVLYVSLPCRIYLPFNVYVQATEALHQRNERNLLISQQDPFVYGAKRDHIPADKEVYVLIIDESLRNDHVSLDGANYRITMPRMGSLSSLTRYTNYYANGVFTMYAVPMMVTRATPETFALNYREWGVQQAFSECGFKTVWLTNEAQLVSDGVSDYVARGAEIIRVQRDMDMPAVVDSLCNQHDKLFVIMHLWGNHQFYINADENISRYLPDVTTSDAVRGEDMYNNAYDNCILYTDSMLMALTNVLQKKQGISQWIFTSDHGEGPIGVHGGAHGYTYPYRSEYHVPLMIWVSDGYKAVYPDHVNNMKRHKEEPVCADHLFWSLLDMADIGIDSTLQQEGMSVFGDTLLPHKRTLLLPDGKSIMSLED
ncbi:MAG: phosphoethanolamine transferase [Paludibacteraceae bacterium]|nr:phosphoethanolamine transferase [Paludibacteraceae bacterium]